MNKVFAVVKSKLTDFKNQLTPKVWPDKSIVCYAGSTPGEWTPDSLKTGIGGSEGDVIYLGREWVKLGYKVTVYNNCGAKEGIYDGVEYLNYQRFNKYDTFDTLIIWRYPWRLASQTKAKRIWLDLHEVLQAEQVTKDKLKKFDKVFVCSQYHRSLVPDIADEKIVVITNGFDSSYWQWSNQKKDPYKLIYASNYVRGLEQMLTYGWPIIKREIPEAHLEIYYGWKGKDETKLERQLWKQKMIELISQPGVTEHGRIGREELVKEKSTSAIHYYACTFQEIDCNSIRESAVVGCVPVTTNYAVFDEKSYCVKISGNPYTKKVQEDIAYKIVELLNNLEELEKIRQQFKELVKTETWENIAKLWISNL
ncbi:glycosyltransferase [Coleofasciculus sp. FACHB-712]|uniref:glycosyltransferase n=1 Tax=Coleofasciculus sp. FACHB-712 TaxID=2692789 RepID=UPI00168275A3|nr:glycosyltransferase [Coleofasciculus sp. FACHB-712]MBD1942611.1 glycosyltransferase [Coleofasciculus sp. FACHB-712]